MTAEPTYVTPRGLVVSPEAVRWSAVRSGGPGGQHANTSDTAIDLTVDLAAAGLHPVVAERVIAALGPVVSAHASDSRSQWRNRRIAWDRVAERIDAASIPPTPRRATKPRKGAVEERLSDKRRQSERKAQRKVMPDD